MSIILKLRQIGFCIAYYSAMGAACAVPPNPVLETVSEGVVVDVEPGLVVDVVEGEVMG